MTPISEGDGSVVQQRSNIHSSQPNKTIVETQKKEQTIVNMITGDIFFKELHVSSNHRNCAHNAMNWEKLLNCSCRKFYDDKQLTNPPATTLDK